MRIAIGSTRPPKVDAVKEAWKVFGSQLLTEPDEQVDFLSYDVPTEAPRMPLSVHDLMEGAKERAENLILQLMKEKTDADFYIGLEGGFNIVDRDGSRRQVFLESWAYVTDGHHGYFGHGGGITVPGRMASPVIDRGIELGIVVDRFTQEKDLRSKEGTWGLLTRNILTRKHSFLIALLAAFAPFYNPHAFD